MSQILEDLRSRGEYALDESVFPLSVKLKVPQQAAVEAVMKLVGNKSDAVRLLIDLGWEAIENDGVFNDVIQFKAEAEDVLSEIE